MNRAILSLASAFVIAAFANSASALSVLKISPNSTVRAGSEFEANYTTTHLYIDEVAGDSIPITIFFDPGTSGVEFAEVFTNLNRRDRADDDANSDGIVDGILPPNGNDIPAGNDANYFKAHTMGLVSGGYQVTLNANKTGAYRLTARFRLNGDAPGTYRYYNSTDGGGKRDHALVVSPQSARDIQLYEVNPLTVISKGTLPSQRGTFGDLAGGITGGPRFNLSYIKSLGCNMLWFQPIHPNGIDGRQIDPDTGQAFEVGSPYAVKNFFDVMPLMAKAFTAGSSPATNDTPAGRAQALAEFQSFSAAADTAGVGVMLDAPFNHTSYDTELGALGQALFGNGGTNANSEMRNTEARFFSRNNAYDLRASSAGNIALAPDRNDFGKFADTYDVFYGRYAALVSGSTGGYQSEADWFDYSVGNEDTAGDGHFDVITRNVWKYFAEYTLHWLTQTGYPANSSGVAIDSDVGVDALRADFGQGLPPQAWEYIINKTRTRKWNFVFMAESLDGGAVTYRSGRHFDILNENIVFPLHGAQNTADFRSIYESRRNAYGQALVLLNTSSHDEDHYNDPWHALIRHAANSTVDGVPLIFPGQELGLSGAVVPPGDTQSGITPFGYDRYETNFGKPIPHFKKYNSLMPLWLKTTAGDPSYDYGLSQLATVYEGIGQARKFSKALRSSNRHFLNLNDNSPNGQIFSVAKFETRNAAPNQSDVVLAFVNLDRNADPATVGTNKFNVNIDADTNGANDFGIKSGRTYNVKNIAAYLGTNPDRRNNFLIPDGISGADLLSQGLFVSLKRVPATDGGWATAPYEAQYLKLYDVTPPPTPAAPVPALALFGTVIGTQVTFGWTPASDPEGGVSGYRLQIGTTPGGNDLINSQTANTNQAVTVSYGTTVYAQVRQINNAGIEGPYSSASVAVLTLNPLADNDGDGQSNGAEHTAGTDPRSSQSALRATATSISGNDILITVATVSSRRYQLETSILLTAQSWSDIGSPVSATGSSTIFAAPYGTGQPGRFYRVRIVP
jgi:glycosidase